MNESAEPPEHDATILMPPELNPAGVYANGFRVWSTLIDFTVDFAVGPLAPDDPSLVTVARVRLSPQVVVSLIGALEDALKEHIQSQDIAGVRFDQRDEEDPP